MRARLKRGSAPSSGNGQSTESVRGFGFSSQSDSIEIDEFLDTLPSTPSKPASTKMPPIESPKMLRTSRSISNTNSSNKTSKVIAYTPMPSSKRWLIKSMCFMSIIISFFFMSSWYKESILSQSSKNVRTSDSIEELQYPFTSQGQKEISTISSHDLHDAQTYRIIHDAKRVDVVADQLFEVERKAFQQHNASSVVLAGILRNSNEIKDAVWVALVEYNCLYNVSIHIVISEGPEEGYDKYSLAKNKLIPQNVSNPIACAPFILHPEPKDLVSKFTMRVDKIAILRDYQRDLLQKAWFHQLKRDRRSAKVILADLDLASIPKADTVLRQLTQKNEHDVICSAGVMHRPFGYYDIFATILEDGTFVYPVRGRLSQTYLKGETKESLIRSSDIYGRVTQFDLLSYFEKRSLADPTKAPNYSLPRNTNPLDVTIYNQDYLSQFVNPVPVQSCFGGFAMYNATKFFHSRCSYSAPYRFANRDEKMVRAPRLANEEEEIFLQYSSKRSKRPCEHIVFHKCLHRVYRGNHYGDVKDVFQMAVLPSWRTEWDAPLGGPPNTLSSSKSRHDGMNTYYNQRSVGERLISDNSKYTLRINENGVLVLEQWPNVTQHFRATKSFDTNQESKVVWKATPDFEQGSTISGWTHTFLWLREDGSLELIRHIPAHIMKTEYKVITEQSCIHVKSETNVSKETPCVCQVKIDGCELLLWSSPAIIEDKNSAFKLVLRDDASLVIISKVDETMVSTIIEPSTGETSR